MSGSGNVLVFPNSKGGAGKSTSSFLLACELAARNFEVTFIDADPNHPIGKWEDRRSKNNIETSCLSVIRTEKEDEVLSEIDKAKTTSDFVLVDLEGTANLSVAYAISRADMVIVPCQRSTLDASEAAKTIALVKQQEKVVGKHIPVSILLTRTSPVIRSKGLKRMTESLIKNKIDVFGVEIQEREAFKAVFDHSSTLRELDTSKVSGINKAIQNVEGFLNETLVKLKACKNSTVSKNETIAVEK